MSFVLFVGRGIFWLIVSGKGVFAGCLDNCGVGVRYSRSIMVVYVLILVRGSAEINFDLDFSTCFLFLFLFFGLLCIGVL